MDVTECETKNEVKDEITESITPSSYVSVVSESLLNYIEMSQKYELVLSNIKELDMI